jgi:hypothetical protein
MLLTRISLMNVPVLDQAGEMPEIGLKQLISR